MKRALTIAGSDCSGGAGIEADLKTFSAFKVFGTAVITAVVAENTVGVQGIFPIAPVFTAMQIESVLSDIGTDAVKIGMLFDPETITAVTGKLQKYRPDNIVIDPVMMAKNGDALLKKEAASCLMEKLFPCAKIVTPNIHEAEAIAGFRIESGAHIQEALEKIKSMGPEFVLIKGGHYGKEAVDFFYDGKLTTEIFGKRIDTQSTHGTGCTYSSAIAALLALGHEPLDAVKKAKLFIQKAIETAPGLGKGHGPLNHNIDTTDLI